jgi:Arc/MetJ-type ribon-helix-helix transcriptional regulator
MSTNLSSDNEAFIVEAVSRGIYRDRTDVLEAGVAMLRRREQLLAMLDESRRQLDEGEYVEFDEDGLKEFAEQLKERARRASESNA